MEIVNNKIIITEQVSKEYSYEFIKENIDSLTLQEKEISDLIDSQVIALNKNRTSLKFWNDLLKEAETVGLKPKEE